MRLQEVLPALNDEGKVITRPKYYGWFKKCGQKLIYTWLDSYGLFSHMEISLSSDDVFATDWRVEVEENLAFSLF
jgi:hypothetical protein